MLRKKSEHIEPFKSVLENDLIRYMGAGALLPVSDAEKASVDQSQSLPVQWQKEQEVAAKNRFPILLTALQNLKNYLSTLGLKMPREVVSAHNVLERIERMRAISQRKNPIERQKNPLLINPSSPSPSELAVIQLYNNAPILNKLEKISIVVSDLKQQLENLNNKNDFYQFSNQLSNIKTDFKNKQKKLITENNKKKLNLPIVEQDFKNATPVRDLEEMLKNPKKAFSHLKSLSTTAMTAAVIASTSNVTRPTDILSSSSINPSNSVNIRSTTSATQVDTTRITEKDNEDKVTIHL